MIIEEVPHFHNPFQTVQMEDRKFGVIELQCEDPFHLMMRNLCGLNSDLVGLYYKRGSVESAECLVLLYNCYTGMMETRRTTTLESVLKCPQYLKLTLRELILQRSGESVGLSRDGGCARFNEVIVRLLSYRSEQPSELEQMDGEKCLRRMLEMKLLGRNTVPHNGYSIVNQALLAFSGNDYSEFRQQLWRGIKELGLLHSPVVLRSIHSSEGGIYTRSEDELRNAWSSGPLRMMDLFHKVYKKIVLGYPSKIHTLISNTYTANAGPKVAAEILTTTAENCSSEISCQHSPRQELPYRVTLLTEKFEPAVPDSHTTDTQECRREIIPEVTGDNHTTAAAQQLRGEEHKFQNDGGAHLQRNDEVINMILNAEDYLYSALNELNSETLDIAQEKINTLRVEMGRQKLPSLLLGQHLSEVEGELQQLKRSIDLPLRELLHGRPPVFELDELISHINQVCEIHGLLPLTSPSGLREGSYGALAVVGSAELRPVPPLIIPTENGELQLLPSGGSNLENCDEGTLREILRYLDGYDFRERRFTPLKIQVTRELAVRRQSIAEVQSN